MAAPDAARAEAALEVVQAVVLDREVRATAGVAADLVAVPVAVVLAKAALKVEGPGTAKGLARDRAALAQASTQVGPEPVEVVQMLRTAAE